MSELNDMVLPLPDDIISLTRGKENPVTYLLYVINIVPDNSKKGYWQLNSYVIGTNKNTFSLLVNLDHLSGEEFTIDGIPHKIDIVIESSHHRKAEKAKNDETEKPKNDKQYEMQGIGYCGACGKKVKLGLVDKKWQCLTCGHYNKSIKSKGFKK